MMPPRFYGPCVPILQGEKGEGGGPAPCFGVEQCQSDILPSSTHISLGSCRSPQAAEKPHSSHHRRVLRRRLAQPLVPTKRETHQTGFTRSPLPGSVCFVVQGCCFLHLPCSLCRPALASFVAMAASSPSALPLVVNVCLGQGPWCDLPQGEAMRLHSSSSLPTPE